MQFELMHIIFSTEQVFVIIYIAYLLLTDDTLSVKGMLYWVSGLKKKNYLTEIQTINRLRFSLTKLTWFCIDVFINIYL